MSTTQTVSRHLPIPALTPEEVERWESFPRRFTESGCEELLTWDRNQGTYPGLQLKRDGRWVHYLATRVAYRVYWDIDPGPATIEHLCSNRRCVARDHLVLLSRAANVMAPTSRSMGRRNADKTHCLRGHAFTEDNTVIERDRKGRLRRRCVQCSQDRHRREAIAKGRPYVSRAEQREQARVRAEIKAQARAERESAMDRCKAGHDLADPKVVRVDHRKDGTITRACRPCANRRARERAARLRAVATPDVTA